MNLSQQIGGAGALSLNNNHLVGGYKGDTYQLMNGLSLANRTSGGKQHLNLTSLLKSSNILDEDGIEDLHFYFVSFSQHKNGILKMHEKQHKQQQATQSKQCEGRGHRKGNKSVPHTPLNGNNRAVVSQSGIRQEDDEEDGRRSKEEQKTTIDFFDEEEDFE